MQDAQTEWRKGLTFVLEPYSLVDGVVSPIIPLTTFSDDRLSIGEFVSNDDLHKHQNMMKETIITASSLGHDVTEAHTHT